MAPDRNDSISGTMYCTSCGEKISADINFCPECGSEQSDSTIEREPSTTESTDAKTKFRHRFPGIDKENTSRRNVLVGAGYTILGLGVLGAIAEPEESTESSDPGSDNNGNPGDSNGGSGAGPKDEQYPNAWAYDKNTGIVLRDVEGAVKQFSVEITGEATNESDQDYRYVQLEFGLYDSTDAKVGDALANTSGLSAGQRWRFEAMGTASENTETFSLENVTAY